MTFEIKKVARRMKLYTADHTIIIKQQELHGDTTLARSDHAKGFQ